MDKYISSIYSAEMDDLLKVAKDAAREAGRVIMSHYGHVTPEYKPDTSPVTAADRGAHEILTHTLGKTGIAILSEEDDPVAPPYPERLWIIDPLDGTKDFIAGTKDFAVMIALLEQGRPVLGVVYAPATNTLSFALRDNGAFMENDTTSEPIRLSVSARTLPDLHYLPSINHYSPFMRAVADRLNITQILPHGSMGIKAALIGEGVGDFFFTLAPVGEWDVCAPEIILAEAGGTVTDIYGNALSYGTDNNRITRGAVFSNTTDHSEILRVLHEVITESKMEGRIP